jgi:RNA recognition motif-containing protein
LKRWAGAEHTRAGSFSASFAGDLSPPQDSRVSTTLYASNLPFTATEETLASKFEQFGCVVSVRIERDATGASRRSAFIEMETTVGARRAIEGLNLAKFEGRIVSVYAAVLAVPN